MSIIKFGFVLKAVADSKIRFNNAFIKYPGLCHDADVWRNSPLRKAIGNNNIRLPLDFNLLGDGAYAFESFLMVPYKDNGNIKAEKIQHNFAFNEG